MKILTNTSSLGLNIRICCSYEAGSDRVFKLRVWITKGPEMTMGRNINS